MKLTVLIAVTAAVVGLSCGAVVETGADQMSVKEKWDEVTNELKWRFEPMGKQMKEVGSAIWDVAKDKGKSLLGQSMQALAGALIDSVQGFDLSKAFGRRELEDWNNKFTLLMKTAYSALDKAYERAAGVFNKVVSRLIDLSSDQSEQEMQKDLKEAAATHKVEVRGVLSDTMNSGIDYIKSLYLKLKDRLTPDLSPLSHPLTISKRALLESAASKLGDHLKSIHEKVKPHIDAVSSIATDVASALAHHTHNLLQQAKANSQEKMEEIVSKFSDHVDNAKEKLSDVKDSLSKQIQDMLSSFKSE